MGRMNQPLTNEAAKKPIRTGSIYIIRNTENEKVYIGQTTMTVHERFMSHMKPSAARRGQNRKLYNAVSKYGADKFFVETLESGIPVSELDGKEIHYIAKYDSLNRGYNSTKGGDGRVINKIDNEQEMLSLAKSGVDAKELAARYGVHKATIYRTLHKLGFFYYADRSEEILSLAASGTSNEKIAEQVGCHTYTVCRVLDRAGKRKHRVPIKNRSDIDFNDAMRDYTAQMPIHDICEKYGISKTTFYRIKRQVGVKSRPQIYKYKTNFRE